MYSTIRNVVFFFIALPSLWGQELELPTDNPFAKVSALDHQAFDFNALKVEHFKPALDAALALAQNNIEAIKNDPRPATYETVIAPLESFDEKLSQASLILSVYTDTLLNETLQQIDEEFSEKKAKLMSRLYKDGELFARVRTVNSQVDKKHLTPEQIRVLEELVSRFERGGVNLTLEKKAEVSELEARIALLGVQFRTNVTKATVAFKYFVDDEKMLSGLPESIIKSAANAATAAKKAYDEAIAAGKEATPPAGKWLFTLSPSTVDAVLRTADSPVLREAIWRGTNSVAMEGEYDNRPLLLEIAQQRLKIAKILGYNTHAEFVLADRMAGSPARVHNFLDELAKVYRVAAERELKELKEFAGRSDLQIWDINYYSEKLKEKSFGFNEEELRPYFQFDRVLAGAFYAAERMYKIKFKERADLPVWHKDVKAFEVIDAQGENLALFYIDPFPRLGEKRAGAWMSTIREGGNYQGTYVRPHVINVSNVAAPVDGKPALLSFSEVTTIFHELGHGLHSMLSQAKSPLFYGTNVKWDFVELPSQLLERWALVDEVLDQYALHVETGERIPAALIEKIRAAQKFQVGLLGIRQIRFGKTDLAWHDSDLKDMTAEKVWEYEKSISRPYDLFDMVPGTAMSQRFSHIFAGGYSAGYYSYKWADVLAADAWEAFAEVGPFNEELVDRYCATILELGGSVEPNELYRRFRGRDADPLALPRYEGLID